jgi:hypothetical protein
LAPQALFPADGQPPTFADGQPPAFAEGHPEPDAAITVVPQPLPDPAWPRATQPAVAANASARNALMITRFFRSMLNLLLLLPRPGRSR